MTSMYYSDSSANELASGIFSDHYIMATRVGNWFSFSKIQRERERERVITFSRYAFASESLWYSIENDVKRKIKKIIIMLLNLLP